jgi:hypothetical protein
VFSGDDSVVAFRLTSLKTAKARVGVDGRPGEEFDQVGAPVLSRDGTRVAYRAQLGNRCFAVLGTQRGPDVEFMTDPALSADGTVLAYAARRNGRWFLRVGERETALDVAPAFVFLSEDGKDVGYGHAESAEGRSRTRVVVAGRTPGAYFDLVGRPVFSPDGRSIAYAADLGEARDVVIDDRRVPVDGRASDPVFSPDGTKVGCGVRVGREIRWKVLDAR